MALTDADRLQMAAIALMRHSRFTQAGGGGCPFDIFKTYVPQDYIAIASPSYEVISGDITAGKSYFATSESYAPSNLAASAFDDNTGTWWSTSASENLYQGVGVDFGTAVRIVKISIYVHNTTSRVRFFSVQASNNFSDWSALYEGERANDTNVQYFSFTNANAYRYYRVMNNGALYSGTNALFTEIQMFQYLSGGSI